MSGAGKEVSIMGEQSAAGWGGRSEYTVWSSVSHQLLVISMHNQLLMEQIQQVFKQIRSFVPHETSD